MQLTNGDVKVGTGLMWSGGEAYEGIIGSQDVEEKLSQQFGK